MQLVADDLPDSLHHYTDASGLMGIVESKSLWATDCRFLNDSSEYQLGLEIVTTGLKDMPNPALDPAHHLHDYADEAGADYRALSQIVQDELITNDFAFVACFCESGDLLSQWRGYSRRHGYSIEFDPTSLRASVEGCQGTESAGTLTRVEYDSQHASDAAGAAVAAVGGDSLNHPGVHGYHLALALAADVAKIKNPGFSEEREWRAIVVHYQAPSTAPSDEVRFRPSGLAIVPFVTIRIDLASIRAVTVGPGPEQVVRVDGAQRWLWSREVDAEVRTSEIPYRPWVNKRVPSVRSTDSECRHGSMFCLVDTGSISDRHPPPARHVRSTPGPWHHRGHARAFTTFHLFCTSAPMVPARLELRPASVLRRKIATRRATSIGLRFVRFVEATDLRSNPGRVDIREVRRGQSQCA